MFIKAVFILWVIIQNWDICLSADLNNSDICWIKCVVQNSKKKISDVLLF